MRRLIVFSFVGVAACSSPTAPTQAPVGQEFSMRPGSTVFIQGSTTAIRFQRVVLDSRCPMDAICVQAGEAVVALGLSSGGSTVDRELSTGFDNRLTFGAYQIALVRVDPYPRSATTIPSADYRAVLLVSL